MSILLSSPTLSLSRLNLKNPGFIGGSGTNPSCQLGFSLRKERFNRKGIGFGHCNTVRSDRIVVKAFCLNPNDEPILKEALKEPVAFLGGIFAGLLRLDLNEEPLKEWVTRTVESAGMTTEELNAEGSKEDEDTAPQEIVIE